jgi:O-antigen ligase
MAAASIGRMAGVCRNTSLVLAGCLPFLVPFDPARNIDLQGLLLIISGGFAWFALLLGRRQTLKPLGRLDSALLGIFAACCLISLAVNPHLGYDFLGAPYIRLGAAGLLACIGIGLLLTTVPRQRLLTWLYAMVLGLSVVSVPYSWWHFHSLLRIGGVFSQADIFACFIGFGLLLGLEMLVLYPRRRHILMSIQVFWIGLLLLAQTRAVLILVIAICLLWELRKRRGDKFKLAVLYGAAALLLVGGLHYFTPNRLTNTAYASESIHYRLALQGYALKASEQKPLAGYGPGNLADALACAKLPAGQLQTTCRQGYFFNSSHNIFIDRVLAIGWLGGLAFLAIVMLAIYRGLRGKQELWVLGYAVALIGFYYLTNVTSVTLELLLWVLLMRCLAGSPKKVNHG